MKFIFQQDDTTIINFDEGVWILCRFSEAMSCHFGLKTHDWRNRKFPLFGSPGKVFALAETKTARIKRSIHYVILQCYNPGRHSKNSSLPQSWLLIQKKQILKMTLPRKMALESKRLHQNLWSWCHFPGKRIFYAFMHSLIWSSPWFLWISDHRCCILSGPPCIGTALLRGPVDGVNVGVQSHRVFTLLFTTECNGYFNVQRVCLSFTLDFHFTSYLRDRMFKLH